MMKKFTLKSLALGLMMFMGVFAFGQYNVTFSVDMSTLEGFDPATTEVFMSGSFAGWAEPGTDAAYKMAPSEEGSLIYNLTTTVDSGEVQYKYFLVIDGAASWNNGEWNGDPNRKVYVVADGAAFSNIWADMPYNVTFNVDMTGADPFDPATDAIYIAGDLANGWAQPGSISAYMLTADATNTIYSITLLLNKGDYNYKYFRVIDGVPSWDNGEWAGDPNRAVTVDTTMTVDNVWGTTGIFDRVNEFTYTMYPNPANDYLHMANVADVTRVEVYDVAGKLVKMAELNGQIDFTMNVSELQTGLYVISVTNDNGVQTSKFIKQ